MDSKKLFLFDLDGTLTLPRKPIMEDMVMTLKNAKSKVKIGVVSGSDYSKICEQLQNNGKFTVYLFPFSFFLFYNGIYLKLIFRASL